MAKVKVFYKGIEIDGKVIGDNGKVTAIELSDGSTMNVLSNMVKQEKVKPEKPKKAKKDKEQEIV